MNLWGLLGRCIYLDGTVWIFAYGHRPAKKKKKKKKKRKEKDPVRGREKLIHDKKFLGVVGGCFFFVGSRGFFAFGPGKRKKKKKKKKRGCITARLGCGLTCSRIRNSSPVFSIHQTTKPPSFSPARSSFHP